MREHDVVAAQIDSEGRTIRLKWDDGFEERLPATWVWDNADEAFEPGTGQRKRSLSELDFGVLLDTAVLDAEALVFRAHTGGEARIGRHRLQSRRRKAPAPVRWLTPEAFSGLPAISADAFLHHDDALREALARLATLGLAMLTGAQARSGVVEQLVARFGFIRETNYGRLFDVRTEAAPSNLAYTARGLDLHTDNPYREPVPTLQLLHAIRSDEHGGETCFVDGFAHAEAMAAEEPEAFRRLAHQAVDFRYAGSEGDVYEARRPIIALGVDGGPQAVHLNHRSLATLTLDADKLADWYGAYRAFHERVHQPSARLGAHLQPGDVAIFDNRRILHGRTAFQTRADGGGRWLQGCYADIDGALATLARLSN